MTTDTNENQEQNGESDPPAEKTAQEYLPKALRNLFDKECLQLDKNRSAELTLLTQGVKTEATILKDWETPLAWSFEGCSEEAQHEGKCWLEREQNRLKNQKAALQDQVTQKKSDIEGQQGTIAALEQEIQALIAELKALPSEIEAAKAHVEELEKALETAGSTRKELLEAELAAAKERRDRISDPAYEEKLNCAIQEVLDSWRAARDELRELSATDTDSLESLTIQIAQTDKKLSYIDKYADLLIATYIRETGLCDDITTEPVPDPDTDGESDSE